MSKYDLAAFVIFVPTLAITVVTLATMYFKYGRREQRALTPDAESRLVRIEQAVDSIAVEVERISEAQRFTAKLLADGRRTADALAASDPQEGRGRG